MMKAKNRITTGFTLIEVLASMAVLVVLMLALMRIFNEATASMTRGTTSVTRAATARAAMEIITRDIEGAVVDGRLAMYKEGETFMGNYDRLFLITMSGDPDDGRAYQMVQYYVTNSVDSGYTNFVLKRATRNFDVSPVDPFDLNQTQKEWWRNLTGFGAGNVVMDNVVRFDVFICEAGGHHMAVGGGQFGGSGHYSSTENMQVSTPPTTKFSGAGYTYPSNTPPAYVEVYLQVTSDDTMKKANFLLLQTTADLVRKGYSLLYQDSFVLQSRIVPIMSYAERLHPITY